MRYKEEYFKRAENDKVKKWVEINLARHLKKKGSYENMAEIEHIIDYLNSDYAPKSIVGLQYKAAKINSQRWVKWLQKKAKNFIESDEDVKVFHDFGNGVKLVQLVGKAAFEREGKLMSHCVASYYSKKDVTIYSLRDALNKPHCTIEVQGKDRINQIKGKGNGSIHPRYIKYILVILKKLGLEVSPHDLPNLGYVDVTRLYWILLESNFDGIQYITFKNTKYFYKYSKLVYKKERHKNDTK